MKKNQKVTKKKKKKKKRKNEGFKVEGMKEQEEEEGVVSTIDEDTDKEENNTHDKDEKENENEETVEDEIIAGENNSISVSRSTSTYCVQKSQAKAKLINLLLSVDNFSDQYSVLKSFLYSPQLKEHVKELQIDQTEERIKIESFDNLAEIMSYSSPKKKKILILVRKLFRIVYWHLLMVIFL